MHVYFSGISGNAIGPLAMLALDAGYDVSGSDLSQSAMLSYLRDRGARVYVGQNGTEIAGEHLAKPIDWFVHTSALPADHAELKFAREQNIKTSKRDEFLNLLLEQNNLSLIAVAGTHGKSTTTGMLIWTLKQLGVPVSYSIGTSISFGTPAEFQKGSEFFIYECDEFDRNFLNFQPQRSLITSYDYDHPDTYPTPLDYQIAFQSFIEQSRYTYLWANDARSLDVKDSTKNTIIDNRDPGISRIKLPGEIFRRNAWLAAQCLNDMLPSIDMTRILEALNHFPGTGRRFEKLADNLYTDFAHHPAEIKATIDMALEINPNLVVVYQPHQNIRQHEILRENGYKDCFDKAKLVIWLPTYLSREDQELDLLTPTDLMNSTGEQTKAEPGLMDDQLWARIQDFTAHGDMVVCMSAGNLDHWLREKLAGS